MPAYRLLPEVSSATGDLVVGDAAGRGESWVLLGTLTESGPRRLLKLDTTAEHVFAILGKRGTGKSYSLGVLLEGLGCGSQSTPIGHSSIPRATLVLDVLDIFWTSTLPLTPSPVVELDKQYKRMNKARIQQVPIAVDVWVPAGYQNAEIDLPDTSVLRVAPSDLTADDWATLFEVDLVSEPRGMLLDEVVRKVSVTGWTDVDGVKHVPMPVYSFTEMLDCIDQDASIVQGYADNTRRSIRQRLGTQAAHPLFQGSPTVLNKLLKTGRVTVLMLGRLPDPMKQVLASILARQVMRERRDASFARKRLDLDPNLTHDDRRRLTQVVEGSLPRTWMLIDEAQVLVPSDQRTLSGETLVKFAKEGRNYGLSLAVATQQPSAVDARLMSQVETLLVHQLTAKPDIDVALRSIKSPLPEEIWIDGASDTPENLIRVLEQGDALFSCANAGRAMARACVVKIRPRVTAHGGYEA
jgi:Helicase HerA, central domain